MSRLLTDDQYLDDVINDTLLTLNPKAHPGATFAALASSNEDLLTDHRRLLVETCKARLKLLAAVDAEELEAMSPQERVFYGFNGIIRVFVKNEPHPKRKLVPGKEEPRLIMNVPVEDVVVEKLLYDPQNKLEISNWKTIPSAPGMGATDDDCEALVEEWMDDVDAGTAASSDAKAWDFSVQGYLFSADVERRIHCAPGLSEAMKRAMANRAICFRRVVFCTSDGWCYAQLNDGIMKSGSGITSSTNSAIRDLVALYIGSEKNRTMGDDCVETFVENAVEKYKEHFGITIKFYELCKGSFSFCSHSFSRDRVYLETWARSLFKLLLKPKPTPEEIEQFFFELRESPMRDDVLEFLRENGWISQINSNENL